MATQTKKPPLTVSNPWWGHDPSDKQLKALWAYEECPNLFYGGAAGPGKTSYLLMAAVQYVQHPHYRALILRKTYADLSLPRAIMDRAIDWWDGVAGARFSYADKKCYFPSGAQVQFGYLASARDHFRYQGAEVHFVGIDEASQIPSHQLRYLHTRIRKAKVDPIPARYRLASNPGDVSHDWLKETYVNGADGHSVVYLPGLMTDNPGLDVEEYRKQLAHLDPVTRKQEEGDWDVQLSGAVLDVTRLKYFTAGEFRQRVRYWDFAATEQKEGVDPDWTAGVLMGVEDGAYQVQDVQRFREGPAEVEVRVKAQAQIDGPSVPVRIEEEPGSSGKIVIDHYARHVLPGRDFRGVRSSGNKAERARPLAAAISNGLVSLRSESPWVRDLVNEMRSFPSRSNSKQFNREEFLDRMPSPDVREAANLLLKVSESRNASLSWGNAGVTIRCHTPSRRSPVAVAWVYPPGVNIGLSGNCCFGAGNWSPNFFESLPTNLREVLENWADLFADDIFVHDVSSPGFKAWAITLEDAAANIDVLANRLDKVLSDLGALESEVDPENLTSS